MAEPVHKIFRHDIRVPYAHVDQMGVVYYANYLVYFAMFAQDQSERAYAAVNHWITTQ